MNVSIINITENPEKIIEYCSRVCYNSVYRITQDSCNNFIKSIIKRKHDSCLEFAHATFEILGISRACQNQFVRSRLNSHLVRSQRYCDEKKFNYIIPESVKKNPKALAIFLDAMKYLSVVYDEVSLCGIKKEDARSVLPNACSTVMVSSANFRQWRHFINLRSDKSAQLEIRNVSNKILSILNKKVPLIFGDLAEKFLCHQNRDLVNIDRIGTPTSILED